jgi:hypothetical protein
MNTTEGAQLVRRGWLIALTRSVSVYIYSQYVPVTDIPYKIWKK